MNEEERVSEKERGGENGRVKEKWNRKYASRATAPAD